jgi:hypothetical protein
MYSARAERSLTYWDTNDQVFAKAISATSSVGKFGFGHLLVQYATTYRGFGDTNDLCSRRTASLWNAGSALDHYFTQHYYFNAGQVFNVRNESFDIKPSTMVRFTPDRHPVEADVNCNILYQAIASGSAQDTGAVLRS